MDEKRYTAATMPSGAHLGTIVGDHLGEIGGLWRGVDGQTIGARIGSAIYGEEWQAKLRWQRESAEQSNRQRALEMAMETLRTGHGLNTIGGGTIPPDGDKVLALAERYFRFIQAPPVPAPCPTCLGVARPSDVARTERAPDDPAGLAI